MGGIVSTPMIIYLDKAAGMDIGCLLAPQLFCATGP